VDDLMAHGTTLSGSSGVAGDIDILEGHEELANTDSLKRRVNLIVAHQEKKFIKEVLNKTNWNRRRAAEMHIIGITMRM